MKKFEFWLKFHWTLFLRAKSTIWQLWFRRRREAIITVGSERIPTYAFATSVDSVSPVPCSQESDTDDGEVGEYSDFGCWSRPWWSSHHSFIHRWFGGSYQSWTRQRKTWLSNSLKHVWRWTTQHMLYFMNWLTYEFWTRAGEWEFDYSHGAGTSSPSYL